MNPEEIIRKMWSSNAFMNVLKIEIKEVHCGGATLVMPIDFDIHTIIGLACMAVPWQHWQIA